MAKLDHFDFIVFPLSVTGKNIDDAVDFYPDRLQPFRCSPTYVSPNWTALFMHNVDVSNYIAYDANWWIFAQHHLVTNNTWTMQIKNLLVSIIFLCSSTCQLFMQFDALFAKWNVSGVYQNSGNQALKAKSSFRSKIRTKKALGWK